MFFLRLAIAMVVCLLPLPVLQAAELQLFPLRLTLSDTAPISAFHLTNTGIDSARVQLTIESWDQTIDGNTYVPSSDILGNPPLFEIPVKGTQTIRMGLGKARCGAVEQAYRAFFQEVPRTATATGGIQTLLRISVPVFIPPIHPEKPDLAFRVITEPDLSQAIEIKNNGNQHVQILKLTITSPAGNQAGEPLSLYVLPGRIQLWKAPKIPHLPDAIHIDADTDQGKITADLGTQHVPALASR